MDKYGKRMQGEEDVGFPEQERMDSIGAEPAADPQQLEEAIKQIQKILRNREPSSMGEMQDVRSAMPSPAPTPTPEPFNVENYLINRSPSSFAPATYTDPKTGMPVYDAAMEGRGMDITRFPENFFSSEYARELQPEERFSKIKSKTKPKAKK